MALHLVHRSDERAATHEPALGCWLALRERVEVNDELDALIGHEVRRLGRRDSGTLGYEAVNRVVAAYFALERAFAARDAALRDDPAESDAWDGVVDDVRDDALRALDALLEMPCAPRLRLVRN